MYVAQIPLFIGCLSVRISLAIGLALGAIAGYVGGVVESVIMRLMGIMLAFPWFLLAVMTTGMLGPSLANAMIAILIAVLGLDLYGDGLRDALDPRLRT